MRRPRVGISACLLGRQVRYDGGHRRHDPLLAEVGPHVEWIPVCPEDEAGLGTPREPILLTGAVDSPGVFGVESGRDFTSVLMALVERRVRELAAAGLDGFILKKSSPSCGLAGVRRRDRIGEPELADGRGLFAAALVAALPGLPVCEESDLEQPGAAARFLERVRRFSGAD